MFGLDSGSTTETKMPKWLKGPTKDALGDIRKWLRSDQNYVYGTKKGEDLFTPMNSLMKGAIGNAKWLGKQDIGQTFGLDEAKSYWDDYANAGKINGEIGTTAQYMDPYLREVLDPAIREITQESERQRRAIGANATMSGAFGDAREGIEQGQNWEKTNQAIADTTGRLYSDAFNNAQQQRNIATERLGTAASGIQGVGDDLFNKTQAVNDSLYNAGNMAYNFEEKRRQTLQQFQEALKNKKYNDATLLLQALSGAPKESITNTQNNTGLFGLLGALAGGLF